jgi:alpha-L-rhamnosidase
MENGRTDLVYQIATYRDQPGWAWWLDQGATTLLESWGGTDSRNHIMFGDISAVFYKGLAGIRPDPAAPGFKHFFVQPSIVGDLTWAKATYPSLRGLISSEWKLEDGVVTLTVTVPPNTTATVTAPYGEKLEAPSDARLIRTEGGRTVYEVGSGTHVFLGRR